MNTEKTHKTIASPKPMKKTYKVNITKAFANSVPDDYKEAKKIQANIGNTLVLDAKVIWQTLDNMNTNSVGNFLMRNPSCKTLVNGPIVSTQFPQALQEFIREQIAKALEVKYEIEADEILREIADCLVTEDICKTLDYSSGHPMRENLSVVIQAVTSDYKGLQAIAQGLRNFADILEGETFNNDKD